MFQAKFVKNQEAHTILCLIFIEKIPILNNVKYKAEGDKQQMEIKYGTWAL